MDEQSVAPPSLTLRQCATIAEEAVCDLTRIADMILGLDYDPRHKKLFVVALDLADKVKTAQDSLEAHARGELTDPESRPFAGESPDNFGDSSARRFTGDNVVSIFRARRRLAGQGAEGA